MQKTTGIRVRKTFGVRALSTEEKKSEKQDRDTFPYFFMMWIPIMLMLVVFPMLDNDDPNSLLTDEQKLEKQKEIADAKELREQEWSSNLMFYHDGISWFVHERPFPFNILIGFGIFFLVARGLRDSNYGYGHGFMEKFMNPSAMIPLTFGLFYLLWVSGELERLEII